MRTMAQKRAEFALKRVLDITAPEKKAEFKKFVNGAPSMILQNGFGQSLAFCLAKGTNKDNVFVENDKHIVLFKMVVGWLSLHEGDIRNEFATQTDKRLFIEELIAMDQQQYLTAQNETMAFLEWVKRFASAGL